MKNALGREMRAFLLERERRIGTNSPFIPVYIILEEDWDKASDVARQQLSLRPVRYPYFRKGNSAYSYRLTEIKLLENADPLGFFNMIEEAALQLTARR